MDDIFSRLDTIPACDGHPAIKPFRQLVRAVHICVAHKKANADFKAGTQQKPYYGFCGGYNYDSTSIRRLFD